MIQISTLNGSKKWTKSIIHLVSDQEQVDLVVLEFEDYAITWWHQLCMDNINQEPPAASGMDIKTLMRAQEGSLEASLEGSLLFHHLYLCFALL